VGNVSTNVCGMQSFVALRCALRKPQGFSRELITTTTRTTRMAFWDRLRVQ